MAAEKNMNKMFCIGNIDKNCHKEKVYIPDKTDPNL